MAVMLINTDTSVWPISVYMVVDPDMATLPFKGLLLTFIFHPLCLVKEIQVNGRTVDTFLLKNDNL